MQPPDFSITLTGTPDPVDALAQSTWVARITNDGPANARISTATRLIRFQVPANMTNLAVNTPSGYTCFIEAPLTVDCQTTATQNLAAGAHVDITMFGTAPRQPGPISMTAIADPLGAIPEGDETDNEATDTITVQPPDFSITLTGTPDPVAAQGNTTWVARITNDGPANARISNTMRLIRFQVPANMTNLAVNTPTGYTCFIEAPQTVDCQATTTQNLAAGAHLDFTMFGKAPADPGPISMTVTADPLGATPEADETDNQATETITVN